MNDLSSALTVQPAPAEHRSRTAAQGSVVPPQSGDAQAVAAARRGA